MPKNYPLVFGKKNIFNFDGHNMGSIAIDRVTKKNTIITINNCCFDSESLREIAEHLDKLDKEASCQTI